MQNRDDFTNKIHLIISVIIVIPVAILYGFFPEAQFELFPKTMDERNFYKAIMGLYLGFSSIWILGIFKARYFRITLITNIIFMLGLGFGRWLSILLDGTPTNGYIFGAFAEVFLGIYGLWVLRKNTTFELKS